MWCVKCRNGHENYNYDHCGHCFSTELTSKNPFEEDKKQKAKKKRKPKNAPKREQKDSIRDDVENIVKGRIKPTPMR